MKRYIFTVMLIAVIVTLPHEAFAGAWTVPKYKIWSELYMKATWAKEQFAANGDREQMPRDATSWGWEIEPKFEYGVTDWLNALCSFNFFESHYEEHDRPATWGSFAVKNNGMKVFTIGGKARFVQKPIVGTIQIKGYVWPGYDSSKPSSAGKGDDALEIRGILSKSFNLPLGYKNLSFPSYLSVESGYRWRNKDVANDIPFFIECGTSPVKWLQLKSELDIVKSHAHTGKQYEDYAVWRSGVIFMVFGDSVKRNGIIFNIECDYGSVVWGKNTTANQEIIIKVQTQF